MSRPHALRRGRHAVVIVAVLAMVAAACGGSGKKATTAQESTTTTSEATTTTTGAGEGTATTASTTSTTAAASVTVTTAKTTATTKKSAALPASGSKGVTSTPKGGITNVTAAPTTAPSKDIQTGGSITWLRGAEITTMDPIGMNGAGTGDGPMGYMIFDELFYSDGGTVTPQTAESLTSTDAVTWTLKLHANIKFTDGTPYDASAVKFNIARIQDPNNHATRAAQANLIASMDVIDAVTLKFTLKAKNALFPGAMTLIPFVGSPAAIQALGSDKFSNAPVGAGPYTLKSWVRDSQMVLVKNPNYWRAPLPYVDQWTLRPIVDETQRINTFCSGQGNLTFIGAVSNADNLQKQGCGVSNPFVLNGGVVLYFNTKKPPMNDIRLRQAVAMALDPKDYSKIVTSGLIAPMFSIFRTDSPFYDPTVLQLPYDPVKAQQLFDQVSADNGGGTINIQMGNFPVVNFQTSGQYLQAKLNSYNHVHVDLTTESSPQHVTTCNTQAYTGICLFAGFFDDPDPGWTGIFMCAAGTNPTAYCNTKFDADVADNEATLDPKQRIADIKDAQKIFYADVPAYYIEQRYSWHFSAPNVQDLHYVNDGLILPDRLWIKTHG